MPPAGHLVRVGGRPLARDRSQASLQEAAGAVSARGHRPRALHPLLPLRALLPGGGRGPSARVPRARRPHLRGHPRRAPLRRAVQREHHRAVPGRGAHLHLVPLPRAALGHRGRRKRLRPLPLAVQRHAHDPRRREGRARARARQRRGGRRLALRQGSLRLPVVRRRGADHGAAGARRRLPAGGVMGARPLRCHRGAHAGRRRDGRLRERPDDQRGGVPGPAPGARRPRLRLGRVARRLARGPGAGPHPRTPRPGGEGVGHRPRRRHPRGRHRLGGRGSDPRPPRAQGGAAQRSQARDAVGAALHPRRERRRRAALRTPCRGGGARRTGRGTRLAPRRGRLPRRAGGASRRRGGLPAGGAERERRSAVARRRRAGGSRGPRPGRRRGGHLGRAHLGRRARAAGDRGPPGGGHGARASRTGRNRA